MKGIGLLVASSVAFLAISCASSQTESKGVSDSLLLKDYAPQSIFRTEQHSLTHPKFTTIDMHSHAYIDDLEGIKQWAKLLDEQGIEKVVINTIAHGEEFERLYDLYTGVSDKFEMWCGWNLENWGKEDFEETAIADLERCYRKGAKGVGELGDKGFGEQYCITGCFTECVPTGHLNEPCFSALIERCGELGMPINVHIGDPIWMYEPLDEHNDGYMNAGEWAIDLSQPGIMDLDQLVETFEQVMTAHPKTTFIAAHFINYSHDYERLGEIMDAHPNLYVDNSARHAETCVTPRATKKFYEKYQDRILFGTDNDPSARMYNLNWKILETEDEHFYAGRSYHWPLHGIGLSDEVLHKIYYENATKILNHE